jgi:hypothetical protein
VDSLVYVVAIGCDITYTGVLLVENTAGLGGKDILAVV